MKRDQLSNMTAQGGIITTGFLDQMRGETSVNPLVKPQAFATFGSPAPESQKTLDEKISDSFYNLVERWDSISNFYDNMDVSEARRRWIIPLLQELGFDPDFNHKDRMVDGDEQLRFRLSHRGWASSDAPMIHTVAPKQDLETRSDDGRGSKRSPHDELQTFLNVSKDHKWGIITNGISFRILRDFFHTTTKGYVEFDIENILRERSYSDFRAFYRMAHASRFRGDDGNGNYPLEQFYRESVTAGEKVGQNLRGNVKRAIEVFGNGFLTLAPELKEQMVEDEELCNDYYSEILRVIYRILFLLYAEQRAMLPTRGSLYIDEYSITRLREIAESRKGNDDHCDLWEGLKITFWMLAEGCPPLNVFAYNGSLFDRSEIPKIRKLKMKNHDLLEAIRCLTLFEEDRMQKRINYLDLDVEEIGSIYESLLDFTPRVLSSAMEIDGRQIPANRFFLDPRGSARKSTGSYYTDKRLVDELIKSALKPVAERRMAKPGDREAAILSLRVCDPACGSGAFLIAATNYLGKELAKVRTGESEPSDNDIRHARRDVLQHCIYGVDVNPMVVELAKVSLWINAAVNDLPLNFLDHHI
ncbi:MAG TPA: restriction endonuclease, partial [Methanosarcinales archaeon]|nr:restriction endonuclease [Methanosarcinales archaeon]